MTKDDIEISVNTTDLEVAELVVRNDPDIEEDGLVQLTLKNTSRKSYKLNSLKLKLYGKNQKYLGYEIAIEEDDVLKKGDDICVEFEIDNFERVKTAELKIKGTAWLDGGTILKILVVAFILLYILAKLSFY